MYLSAKEAGSRLDYSHTCLTFLSNQKDSVFKGSLHPNLYSHADIVLVLSAQVWRYQSEFFMPPPRYNGGEIESNGFFQSSEQLIQNPIHLNQGGSRSFRIGSLKNLRRTKPKLNGWIPQVYT